MEDISILERTNEDVHLSNEAGETRKTEVGQTCHHISHREERHNLHQTTQTTNVTSTCTVIDHTDNGEEEGRHQTVRQHLQDGTGSGSLRHHKKGEEHHAAVRHGRISVDVLKVGLHTSRECAVYHRDGGEDQEDPRQLLSSLWQEEHSHTEAAVTSELHQHTCMKH